MAWQLTDKQVSALQAQRSVFAVWQLGALELESRWVQRRVAARLWRRIGTRCVLAAAGPPTVEQLRFAACLEMGPAAVLAGQAALVEAGWTGKDPGRYDVLVPRTRRMSRTRKVPEFVRLRYAECGGTVMHGVARCANARGVVDAAAWAASDREADFIVVSCVQQRLVTTEQLRAELAERKLRRAALLRQALADIDFGVESAPELLFLRGCRSRGLPTPRMQQRTRAADGRMRRVDFVFDLPGGGSLMVEVDGAGHLDAEQAQEDALRTSSLARATGAHTLRVPYSLLRHDPEVVFGELRSWLEGGAAG
jgi:very-short-patch-repair endonuclease